MSLFIGNRKEFACMKFFWSWDVPIQIAGHPGHSVSKTTEKGASHKFWSWTSQGRGQGHPDVWVPDVPGISCPKTLSVGCFSVLILVTFELLSRYFWGTLEVALGGLPHVTFVPLFCDFSSGFRAFWLVRHITNLHWDLEDPTLIFPFLDAFFSSLPFLWQKIPCFVVFSPSFSRI